MLESIFWVAVTAVVLLGLVVVVGAVLKAVGCVWRAHASDCAVHNAPAFEPGSCDCFPSKVV